MRLTASGRATFIAHPMMHVADKSFYASVSSQVETYDAVLAEGIPDKKLSDTVEKIYRKSTGGKDGLTQQSRELDVGPQQFSGDIDAGSFANLWRKVPRWRKLMIWGTMGVASRLHRTRRFRRWLLSSDKPNLLQDKDSMDRFLGRPAKRALDDDRNEALFDSCRRMMDGWSGYTIGVVWGTVHIPPLVEHLTGQHGYDAQYLAWITALSNDP